MGAPFFFTMAFAADAMAPPRLFKPLLELANHHILARTAFRIVEYLGLAATRQGPGSDAAGVPPAAIRYELFFYLLEAGLMLAHVVMFNARHRGGTCWRKHTMYLTTDGG
ncbi:hypothetical protein LX36DRAFT_713092 [Colletotrichum falcatum]|nr:hypothetical protein LX36DRAFT_713092 [Colletotrichum falcatum]